MILKVLNLFIEIVADNNINVLFTTDSINFFMNLRKYEFPTNFLVDIFISYRTSRIWMYLLIAIGVFAIGCTICIAAYGYVRNISIKNNYGHIAIATGEGNTNTFYSYDSNWNKKEMQKVKHTYFALYGVLRPKNIKALFAAPDVSLGDYSLTNVRGIYNFAGAKSGRKKVKEITRNAKKSATSQKADNNAYLKAGTAVSVLETKLISTGNLWARIPSGWICIWEHDKDKLFIK